MPRYWFIACISSWLAGALLWHVPQVPFKLLLWLAIFSVISALIVWCIRFRATAKISWIGWIFFAFAVGLVASLGVMRSSDMSTEFMRRYEKSVIQGIVVTDVSETQFGGYQFDMRFRTICSNDSTYCEKLQKHFRARVIVSITPSVTQGSTVSVAGILLAPKQTKLGDSDTTFADYLLAKGVCCTMQSARIVASESARGLYRVRNKVRELFWNTYRSYLQPANAAIAAGIVYGEKAHIPNMLENTFRTAGLSHIMVLSGSNVTIMLIILLPLFSIIRNRFVKFLAHTLLFAAILFFLGSDPPLLRAVIMAALAYLVKERGNPALGFRALCFSAIIMASINPAILLYDVSFHLSFLATLGMVLGSDYFENLFSRVPEKFILRETLAITAAVSLFVYPYSMYQFGTFAIYGLIANLLVVPFVPIVMALSALLVPVALFSYAIGFVIALPFKIAIGYIISIAHFISALPFSTINFSLSLVSMIAIYCLLCVSFRKMIV